MDTAASTDAGSPFAAATTSDAYAIPIGKALAIATRIEDGESSSTVHVGGTAFLGVDVESASAAYDGYGYGSEVSSGALIADTVSGGPADAAGLAAGDVITAVDGHQVATPAALSRLLLTERPGKTVTVAYVDQYGNGSTARVRLGDGPPQ
jgi:S1-C subfamily serine protease